MQELQKYNLIVSALPKEMQGGMSDLLAKIMDLPLSALQRIVANAPIAVFSGLALSQAEQIKNEILKNIPGDFATYIKIAKDDNKTSRLEWPVLPKINSKSLTDFLAEESIHELFCPACGISLLLNNKQNNFYLVIKDKNISSDLVNAKEDPLFAGLDSISSLNELKSVQDINAGDTGFWSGFDPRLLPDNLQSYDNHETAGASSSAKSSTGLTAYIKPGPYSVIIKSTTDSDLIRFVSDLLGISDQETREKCLKPTLCIAKNISKEEAQALLARLRSFKTEARIVRPL